MNNSSLRNTDNWAPTIAKITFLLLTAIICGTVIYIIRDFLHAIILGLLFGGIMMPVHNRILRGVEFLSEKREKMRKKTPRKKELNPVEYELNRHRRNRSIASLLTVTLVFFIIVLPLTLLVASIVRQSYTAIPSAKEWVEKELPGKIREIDGKYKISEHLEDLKPLMAFAEEGDDAGSKDNDEAQNADGMQQDTSPDIGTILVKLLHKAVNIIGKTIFTLFSKIWIAVFNFFILLFVMYHVFHDGRQIVSYLQQNSPLGDEEMKHVGERIKLVFKAICVSVFGTAIIQGLLGMVIFRIVGIPALFWGTILGICSIIPVVGTAIVWVPAAAYLFMIGSTGQAILLILFCGGLISNVDNILRPLLMKKSGNTGMSYLVLFFAILGGLQTFGLVGIIYGPLITGICSICLLIFNTQFKPRKTLLLPTENNSLQE